MVTMFRWCVSSHDATCFSLVPRCFLVLEIEIDDRGREKMPSSVT